MHIVLHIVAAVSLGTAIPSPQAPIEAFVSPPSLFPVDGQFGTHPGAPKYRPIPAYDAPNGAAVGTIVTVAAKCTDCQQAEEAFFVMKNGSRHALEVGEWSYDTKGLVTRAPVVASGKTTWSKITYASGAVWVSSVPAEVHPFEILAHRIDKFDEFCTAPDKCAPLSAQMKADVKKFEAATQSCFGEVYNVKKVVGSGTRRFYQVELAELPPDAPPSRLPAKGYIPVRAKDGQHTGTFDPRGC